MTRQIAIGYTALPAAVLEQRILALEASVAALAEAVGVLAHGMEGTPSHRQDFDEIAHSARAAHELLLAADLVPSARTAAPVQEKAEAQT